MIFPKNNFKITTPLNLLPHTPHPWKKNGDTILQGNFLNDAGKMARVYGVR